jgi:tryptophan halogenase
VRERARTVVVGGGVGARMAAVAIARQLPGTSVTRLELPSTLNVLEDALGAARPSIRAFHRLLGIDDAQIVGHTRSGYWLGTQIQGWSERDYFRAQGGGEAIDGGLQLYLPAYRHALQSLGQSAGVEEIAGRIASVELSPDGCALAALHLGDGRRLGGDFFVDVSGPEAHLRRRLGGTWVDWSAALPTNRLIVTSGPAAGIQTSHDRLLAQGAGWTYEAQTPGSTVRMFGYAAEYRDDMTTDTGVPLRQGRLAEPWRGNCVAIGSAAVTLEPSAATGLHLLCRHIQRLIDTWPGLDARATAVEVAFFNRRTEWEAERLRDFVQLSYLLNRRPEPFWRSAATRPSREQLNFDLEVFRHKGRLRAHDEDTLASGEWLQSLRTL